MKQCVFFNFFPISVRHVLILIRLTLKIHSQPVSFTFHNFWFPNRAPITDKLFSQSTRNHHCFSYGSAISICLLSPIEYKTYFDFSFWSQYTFIQRLISVCSFSSQKIHNFWFPNMAAVRQATLHFCHSMKSQHCLHGNASQLLSDLLSVESGGLACCCQWRPATTDSYLPGVHSHSSCQTLLILRITSQEIGRYYWDHI